MLLGFTAGLDSRTTILLSVVMIVLAIAHGVGRYLLRQSSTSINPAMVQSFNARVRSWWMMFAILTVALLIPLSAVTVFLFFLVSFWALREFITLTPTRIGDHRALFWVFFIFTPLQYLLVWSGHKYYGLYSILLPVYGVLFIPARVAFTGDYKRFLERTAKIQAGLFICVYALSYAPALLDLQLKDAEGNPWAGNPTGVLFFFILIVQMGDVFQYAWGKVLGKHVIAPAISANKTWEGFLGGVLSTALLGMILAWVTPFNYWAAGMSFVTAIMGFAGSMTMSAIKRDRGVHDYGTLVQGHPGVLDRIDSTCFAAPVFFHLTKAFFT